MAYVLSKTIKGASSGNISGSLFNNSWINILKCDKSIPTVHAELYSLSTLDWATGPGTFSDFKNNLKLPAAVVVKEIMFLL